MFGVENLRSYWEHVAVRFCMLDVSPHDSFWAPLTPPIFVIWKPQMWERAQLGFGGTGRKRKGPCTKQCAWRKHGSCDTRLAEACPPKLWNTVKYSVEEMRPKWPFWKHRAPKMRLAEAQCAPWKHCYPETPLGSHPTSRVSQCESWVAGGNPKMRKRWLKNRKLSSAIKVAQEWQKLGFGSHLPILSPTWGHLFPMSGCGQRSFFRPERAPSEMSLNWLELPWVP